jgi:hypothetical protein
MPTFDCPHPITLDVRLGGGSLRIIAEERDTAEVEVLPEQNNDASQEAATNTMVQLHGDTLFIHAPDQHGWLRRRSSALLVTARVPAGTGARIKTMSADVNGTGQLRSTKLNTASGNLRLDQINGDLTVKTASGHLHVIQVDGRLTGHTASGNLTAEHVTGPTDVKSASGDLRIDRADADVAARSVSGDIRLGAARQGAVSLTTVSGDASVGVVAGTGVWLDLTSVSGRTRNELTMTGEEGSDLQMTVTVRSVSGDITVHRAAAATQP